MTSCTFPYADLMARIEVEPDVGCDITITRAGECVHRYQLAATLPRFAIIADALYECKRAATFIWEEDNEPEV